MKSLRSSTIALSVFVILSGCQKVNTSPSPFGLLTSKVWKLEAYGTDINMNNVLDALENSILECQEDDTYAFYPDGMGLHSVNSTRCGDEAENSFQWELLSDNTRIVITLETFSITRLTEQELVLRHDLPGPNNDTILRYSSK